MIMFIFTGLESKEQARQFWEKWRDIIMESHAYELIKEEGRVEGRIQGKAEGKAEGRIETIRQSIEMALNFRFGADSKPLVLQLHRIQNIEKLESLLGMVYTAHSVADILRVIEG